MGVTAAKLKFCLMLITARHEHSRPDSHISPAEPYHNGGDVGHGGCVMTHLALPLHHAGVGVAGRVAEHRVEDCDAVGSDHAHSAELLDDTYKHNDQERFVHFGVASDVSHVVALPLLISPARSRLS